MDVTGTISRLSLFLAVLVLGAALPMAVLGQDGPGGVENTTGTSNLRIWLRADEGVSPATDGSTVTDWLNQSEVTNGDPTRTGNPVYVASGFNAKPVIRFDGTDDGTGDEAGVDQFTFGTALDGVPDGENTLIVVSSNSGTQFNQALIGFGPIGASGAPNARGILYDLDNQTAGVDIVLAAISGDAKGTGNDKLQSGDKAVSTSYNTATPSIFSSIVETQGQASQDLFANGDFLDTGDASTGFDDAAVGEQVIGDIAEVIAFDRRLNAAELTIVKNYLSAKYGITLGGSISDVYGFDGSYGADVAGVGTESSAIQNAPSGNQQVAQSSGLYLDVESALPAGDYALFGHDEANFAFTAVEPPNGRENIQKLAREWRIDMTGSTTSLSNVTMGFDESTLPTSEQLGASVYNDYFLVIDADGDFSDGNATLYDLDDQGSGLYTNPDVTVNDGDYVTVAHIERRVTFTNDVISEFEDTAATNGVSVEVSVNFKNSTQLSIPYSVTDGTPAPEGTDYTANAGSFTISAGSTTGSASPFTVADDGENEPDTEFIEVTFGTLPANVSAGSITLFEFGILDDDNPREIAFDTGNPTSVQEGNNGTKRQTFTVTLVGGDTGPASATYSISGTATAGEDYEIVGASSPSDTRGTVNIASGASTGTFEVDIIGDEVDQTDETLVIDLIAAQSATLDRDGTLQETFTILDDDPTPEVNFTSATFSGEEGQTVDVTVELETASGQDLDVTIQDDTAPDSQPGGPAESNDYTIASTTITIPAGDLTAAFSVSLATDAEVETTESIELSITDGGTDPPLGSVTTSTTVSIIDASGDVGFTGPGGVGDSESVSLWLRSDQGISVTAGSPISNWADQSGNGNDATNNISVEQQPTFGTNQVNGIDVVTFDGSDDFLRSNVGTLPGGANTLFSVSDAGGTETLFGIDDDNFTDLRSLGYADASTARASQNGTPAVTATGAGGVAVLSSVFDGTDVSVRVNGGTESTSGASPASSNGIYSILGGNPVNNGSQKDPDLAAGNPFSGDVGEFIAYSTTLNQAQELIVTNYLGAKYGITTLATDLYDGDVGPDGTDGTTDDRDTDVLGVGQASNGDRHFRASGGGLELSVAGGIDDGEYILAGRQIGVEQRINTTDVGGVTGLTARLNDDRYLDITGELSVDITFDFGDFGVEGPAGDVSSYVLIRRDTDGTGGWETVSTSASVSGDRVTFANISLEDADDGYYTIGTTSSSTSPLDARFTSIGGVAGTSGDNTVNGGDAGYLTLGLPVTGGSIGDLVLPDGTQIFDATALSRDGLRSGFGILYTWDYGSQSFNAAITDPTQTLENGRGFFLWVKDTPEVPVDPELNLGLFDLTNEPTTNVNKSVTDASGTFVFLANPYLSAYDMTAFTAGGGTLADNGFQSTIASWDPDNGGQYGSYVIKTQGTVDDDIARYQGFFLERTATGSGATNFTFDVTGQLDTNVELVGAKSTSSQSTLAYRRLGLQLSSFDASGTEVTRDVAANVVFVDGASAAWDAYDAVKYQPPSRRYATLAPVGTVRNGSTSLKSQESRPFTPDAALDLPMDLTTRNVDGTMRLSVRTWENIPSGWTVTLTDTKGTAAFSDDETVVLSPDAPAYTFEAASAKATSTTAPADLDFSQGPVAMTKSSTEPRFRLTVEPSTDPLPVELSTLRADVEKRDVIVSWATATETNNAGFAVERKTEEGAYEEVAFVDGAGTTDAPREYRQRIRDLDFGAHTFRLRQVDTDGTESLSKEVTARVTLNEPYAIGLPYPNPASQKGKLDVTVRESQDVRVELYDMLGRRVRVLRTGPMTPQRTKTVDIDVQSLASGMYFVRITGEAFAETRRLTVIR